MAIDPRVTLHAAGGGAHRARRSAGRLIVSGVGFSVAYFLDPAQGAARRRHAVEVISQVRHARAVARTSRGATAVPPTGGIPNAEAVGPLSQGANGVRARTGG